MMEMTNEQVKELLPHRAPMLLVDTVSACVPMESVTTHLYLDPAWDVFKGHFPGNPVFPGVLSVECMAQAADIMVMTAEQYAGKEPLFASIREARFKKKLTPGDHLTAKVTVAEHREDKAIITAAAELYAGEELAATALLTIAMR